MPNVKLKSYLHLHFIVFIWGFTGVLGELISVGSFEKVWYRMSIALLLIGIYVWYKKISLKIPLQLMLTFIVCGFVIALHWVAFFEAIEKSNVSVTLATLSTGAFFTSILEPIFYRRRIIYYELFFGLLVIAGLYTIFKVETEHALGILLALIAALLSSLFSILNGKLIQEHKASVISLYEIGFGILCLSIYMAFTNGFDASFFAVSLSD